MEILFNQDIPIRRHSTGKYTPIRQAIDRVIKGEAANFRVNFKSEQEASSAQQSAAQYISKHHYSLTASRHFNSLYVYARQ